MPIAQLEFQLDKSILTQRTLRFRIGGADVRLYCDEEAYKLRDKVVVPGFRKGHAPLELLRRHAWRQVEPQALAELKKSSLDQVLSLLPKEDHPFLPPEVLEPEKVRLKYDEPLEFAVKYMVDPTSISHNPQAPQPQQGAFIPGIQMSHPAEGTMGIPDRPKMPGVQIPTISPVIPTIPASE